VASPEARNELEDFPSLLLALACAAHEGPPDARSPFLSLHNENSNVKSVFDNAEAMATCPRSGKPNRMGGPTAVLAALSGSPSMAICNGSPQVRLSSTPAISATVLPAWVCLAAESG
jgi:hypothetical protein